MNISDGRNSWFTKANLKKRCCILDINNILKQTPGLKNIMKKEISQRFLLNGALRETTKNLL